MASKEADGGRPVRSSIRHEDPEELRDLSALATPLYGERYEVLELLGVGASGSVYRARDVELNEHVALKVLRKELVSDSHTLERFRNEVRLARRVTHRNVARVFDIGEHEGERFLTMELVRGRSLRKRMEEAAAEKRQALPLIEVVEILTQICAGLQAAHDSGVVHCDLKPDNILLAEDGRVVVTDFGIARGLMQPAVPGAAAGADATASKGRAGRSRRTAQAPQIDGTPMYISPEQISGDAVDARADLYSLGALLYELLAGEPPFSGQSTVALLAARVLRPPPDPRALRPGLPQEIAQAVTRCLAVKPSDRFPSAAALAAALEHAMQHLSDEKTQVLVLPREAARSVAQDDGSEHALILDAAAIDVSASSMESSAAGQAGLRVPTVLVLPLENRGEAADADWATGIARELTDGLAAQPGLSVVSQAGLQRVVERGRDALTTAQQLGADWVISGSVHRSGSMVRLTVRLVRASDGTQLYSARRESPESHLLAMTEALSAELGEALLPAGPQSAAVTRSAALAASQFTVEDYLRARALYERADIQSIYSSVGLLKSGLARAPDEPRLLMTYALAMARLWFYGDGEAAGQALAAAERLVAVQPGRAESHMALASVRFQGADLVGAMQSISQALALRADFAEAHELQGRILVETGPIKLGMEHLGRARRIDPGLQRVVVDQARVLALIGHPDQAHDLLADRTVVQQTFAVLWILRGRLCLWQRDGKRAAAYLQDPELQAGSYSRARLLLQVARGQARVQPQDVLAAGLASDKSSPRGRAFFFQMHAELFAFFDQRELAVRSIARSVDAGLTDLVWLERCPLFRPLFSDPRVAALRQVVYSRALAVRETLAANPLERSL